MKQFDLQGNEYDCQIEQNHSVIVTKLYSLEKQIEKKEKEIERLNNIINELEKYIKNNKVAIGIKKDSNYAIPVEYVLDKLQELKGDNK